MFFKLIGIVISMHNGTWSGLFTTSSIIQCLFLQSDKLVEMTK